MANTQRSAHGVLFPSRIPSRRDEIPLSTARLHPESQAAQLNPTPGNYGGFESGFRLWLIKSATAQAPPANAMQMALPDHVK